MLRWMDWWEGGTPIKDTTNIAKNEFINAVKFVLTLTYFTFNGIIYKQTFGTLMDSPFSSFLSWRHKIGIIHSLVDRLVRCLNKLNKFIKVHKDKNQHDTSNNQTLSELGKILQVDESTVSKGLGMIQKQGHWVPYELKPRDVERRFGTCELLLQRQKRKGFLPDIAPSDFHLFRSMAHGLADRRFHSYEEAQKWIDSWIASKDMSFFRRGIHVLPERWEKVVSSDGQYFK
ncbi:MOS1T transposase, partial [Pseudoatta argentina]